MTSRGQLRNANGRQPRPRLQAAFSLVELVIVVVIIGIIAAIAAPRFSRATASATESYLKSTITTVQRAIELYHAEHGKYPGYNPANGSPSDAAFAKQLLAYSDAAGNTQAAFGSPYIYGPYLRPPFPKNPFNKLNTVKVIATPDAGFTAAATGWVAILFNGDFRINATDEQLGDFDALDLDTLGASELPGFQN